MSIAIEQNAIKKKHSKFYNHCVFIQVLIAFKLEFVLLEMISHTRVRQFVAGLFLLSFRTRKIQIRNKLQAKAIYCSDFTYSIDIH